MIYIYIFLIIFVITCAVIVFFLLSAIAAILFSKVPYCPTPDEVIDKIIKELNIKPNQIIYDLGCGDGRFLFAAEKLGAKTFGFEISLPSYLRAQLKIITAAVGSRNGGKKHKLSPPQLDPATAGKTKIYFKNFYHADLSNADIVFCFLTKQIMGKVEQFFKNKLKTGTTVVIYGAPLPSMKAFKTINGKTWPNGEVSKVNFYKI